jgi:UDP-GlcNAc:undecaprenyl-phosphate GlcNAc-1-phosphate transferase
MISLFVTCFIVSCLAGFVLIRRARGHAARYSEAMPQRFHVGDVPRLGGVAVLLGAALGWMRMAAAPWLGDVGNTHYGTGGGIASWQWLAMAVPAAFGGFYEDLTQRLNPKWRLLLTGLSGLLAVALMGVVVSRLGIALLDAALAATPWVGLGLAILAVTGLPHAINIIDGYNGLAGTVALIVCLALVHVSLQVGDRHLAGVLICLSGATAGFLVWNYPSGRIFAGDGGAYLWGVVIAAASLRLVQQHAAVSPWFPMLLLVYPVWETLFSIYRKSVRGVSPGTPDALHFHQLIYRRIVRQVFEYDDPSRQVLARNNRTSPYLWAFTLMTAVPALMFWSNTPALIGFCALFVVTYVVAYLMIVRFKLPRWIRR